MSILSLTFHSVPSVVLDWKNFLNLEIKPLIDNVLNIGKFILSEVDSEMITEGENTNLLLVFADEKNREEFIENQLEEICQNIEAKFGDNVMIFRTYLDPIAMKF